jgi:hypothetical protein
MAMMDRVLEHERETRRSLIPFGVGIALALIGFIATLIVVYR